jgi:hypothetical protein
MHGKFGSLRIAPLGCSLLPLQTCSTFQACLNMGHACWLHPTCYKTTSRYYLKDTALFVDLFQAVCPQGYTCVWFDKWYSQCRPAQTEVTATPLQVKLLEAATQPDQAADTAAQLQPLSLWSQCGGLGGCSGDSPCSAAAWSTVSQRDAAKASKPVLQAAVRASSLLSCHVICIDWWGTMMHVVLAVC